MSQRSGPVGAAMDALLRAGLAAVTVAIALGLALAAQAYAISKVEFPLFLTAVAVTVWNAGAIAGTLAVVLSSVTFNYFFTDPRHTLYIESADRPLFVTFTLFALTIASFAGRRRRVENDLRTARTRLEMEVAERTQQASLLNLTHDSIFVRDMNDVITYWNRGAQKLYGWTPEQAIGRNAHELLQAVYTTPIDAIREELLRTDRFDGEVDKTTADGTRITVASRWSLRRNEQGRPVAILETNNDVTEHKRTERRIRTLNEDLEQRTNELEATNKELEAFAYSVSHDLRAPLRHMVGYAELLLRTAGSTLDAKQHRFVTLILDAAKRMGQLIDDLLAFSRIGRAETRKTRVSLEPLVRDALAEVQPEADGRTIDWTVGTLPDLYVDRAMVRLVLVNLVSNAVKFTRTRPDPKIEIGCTDGSDGDVVIFVRDNGVGFDMKYVHKLFGVFQRLHTTEAFEGTGIGLATVQRIVHRHGGRVWAESAVGQGATFYVALPKRLESNA